MKRIRTCLAAAMATTLLGSAAVAQDLETDTLSIETESGVQTFNIEIADEPSEISYGLMNRESLAADAGMLFDFGNPREPAMYMKNTLIPLDMLFITSDGTIQMIARNAVPGSLRTISPGMPVLGVLEINGGAAAELGIQPGDTVNHEMFSTDDGQ